MFREFISSLRRWLPRSRPARPVVEKKRKPALEVLEDRVVPAWTVNDLTTLTPANLVQNLLGPGVTATNITYTGANVAAGIFSDPGNSTGITDGVVLSSGGAKGVAGPNSSTFFSTSNGTPSDAGLDAIIAPSLGFDAAVLEFDFVPKGSIVAFQYVFGSDEYNEFAPPFGGGINDVFAFFLNGKNIALLPGTSTPVSITNVNAVTNASFFVDNDIQPIGPRDTQMDGFTTVLSATVTVKPGVVNHIKLAIEDSSDTIYDSWVLMKKGSIGAADIRTYAPLRTVYNRFTGLYAANFVVASYTNLNVSGPLFLAFLDLPTGVTIANAKGKTSSGAPLVPFPGGKGLPAFAQLKITVYFRNPLRQNLGTFFLHRPLVITAGDL